MVVVPQSFGDLLVAHPHAHALVSLGVFLGDGTFYPLDDADFSALEAIFRERVFDFMIQKEKITPQVAEDMRAWPHSGFQVSWKRRIEADDRKGLEGLLAYRRKEVPRRSNASSWESEDPGTLAAGAGG